MTYYEKILVHISDSAFRLIISLQLRKMIQRHQIMCGYKLCIQARTYQQLLNNWYKQRLRYINNNANSFTRGSVEQFNEDFFPVIVMLYYLMENRFTHVLNMLHLSLCVTFLINISKYQSGHVC